MEFVSPVVDLVEYQEPEKVYEALVFKLGELEPIPDADNIVLTKCFGYQSIVTKEYKTGDLCIFLEPETIADNKREEFSFLSDSKSRIRAQKLRGVISSGLIIKKPDWLDMKEGDNAFEALGLKHYNPDTSEAVSLLTRGGVEKPPGGIVAFAYDLDSFQKYSHGYIDGEIVNITEKLNGSEGEFLYSSIENRMYCKSRKEYKKQPEKINSNIWWRILSENSWIEDWCKAHPDYILKGEVYGHVQKGNWGYDIEKGQYGFRVFDIFYDGKYISFNEIISNPEFKEIYENHWVPILYVGPYSIEIVEKCSSGKSALGMHIREGCVVNTCEERQVRGNRMKLKSVSVQYHLDKKGKIWVQGEN